MSQCSPNSPFSPVNDDIPWPTAATWMSPPDPVAQMELPEVRRRAYQHLLNQLESSSISSSPSRSELQVYSASVATVAFSSVVVRTWSGSFRIMSAESDDCNVVVAAVVPVASKS
jgi:hypothetical protein